MAASEDLLDAERARSDLPAVLDDALADDEAVRLTWEATGVQWADEWRSDPRSSTFVATDRRVLFTADDTATAIGYGRIRAVKTDAESGGLDLSTAFLGCGGLGLLVGLAVATDDFSNGVGLVLLSVALLAAGSVTGDASTGVTVTLVIGNERQRLSFAADESVGAELALLAGDGPPS